MKPDSPKWAPKALPTVSWAVGFVLVLSACSATAVARSTAPEMDPSLATGAIALLSGGLLLIGGRRHKSK